MSDPTWLRIDEELRRRRQTWAWLAMKLGTTDQTVNNWSRRKVPPTRYADIAYALNWTLDQLVGDEHGGSSLREPVRSGEQVNLSVAHPMSLDEITVPSTLPWGDVEKMQALPARFTVQMPDDSLSGHIERGTGLIFERDLAPAPGKTVLIEDNDGNRFIRLFALVRGEHWQAQHKAAGYVTLDSKEHGLRVLATMRWREG